MLAIAAARGYPADIEFAQVHVDEEMSRAAFIVTVDWLKYHVLMHVNAVEVGGLITEEDIAAEMPLWIPPSLPPVAEVWAALRSCDADAMPYFCHGGPVVSGYFVGECGGATLRLWDVDIVGSGMSAVECYPSDAPCCEPEFP
ncbi:MAG: hypothetical protein A2138_25325 [Deltaproteobacteria bacterium RBG_16_71_12]|nr:MAG: hypothetical protein A2138_25325 [Deltaproteobacteria bacterium RBG_16_71_12]